MQSAPALMPARCKESIRVITHVKTGLHWPTRDTELRGRMRAPAVCILLVYRFGILFFFFFQAEDGIRDLIVTGVQTCALPIYLERRESFGVRKIQRRHRKLLLAGDAERRPARRDHLEGGTRSEQLADDRSGGKDLFEVVEHEQHPLSLDVIEHARKRHLRAAYLNTEGVRDRRRNELRIADRREREEESAVAECRRRLLGDPQRQSGLSRPSRPGQRDESRLLEEPLPFGDLALAADEARRLRWQERRGAIECPKRRKVGSAPADHELIEVLRIREIFQPELTEVADRYAVAKIRTRQGRRCF